MDKLEQLQKRAEIALKKAQIIKEKADAKSTEEKLKIEKMKELHEMISAITVNEEKQIVGCDMVFKPVYTETEQYTLKQKLFDIVKSL